MVVNVHSLATVAWAGVLAQTARQPIQRLDPVARGRLIGGLILLTIGGVALVVLAWLALRAGRRHVQREDAAVQRRTGVMPADDWAQKSLNHVRKSDPGAPPS